MENQSTGLFDIGSMDFTPDWARKPSGVTVAATAGGAKEGLPRQTDGGARGNKFPPRGRDGAGGFRGGNQRREGRDQDRRPRPPRREPFPFDVKILPEPKALGTIFRKLQQDFHAYKLKDLAYFLLDNPSSVQLKLSPRAGAKDGEARPGTAQNAPEKTRAFQCKACGFVSTDQNETLKHVAAEHLTDYYDAKEIECEPPSGNFNCVAKCGLDGVYLGPPNIHEFNANVRERIRTAHPGMSEEEYRSHIVMVRDKDAIEEWRKSATRKTVYTAKNAGEGAPELSREQAEAELRRNIAPSLVDTPKNIIVPADVAMKSPVAGLRRTAEEALANERRNPYAICFALRGAFHHRKMFFFRANDNRGQEFVTAAELKPFDAAHAIPELARIAKFIDEHPCATKQDIVRNEEDAKQLSWLVSTGHVVSFTNGVFSAVEKYPKYGPQWQKWRKAEKTPDESTPAAPLETKTEDLKEETKQDETPAQLA